MGWGVARIFRGNRSYLVSVRIPTRYFRVPTLPVHKVEGNNSGKVWSLVEGKVVVVDDTTGRMARYTYTGCVGTTTMQHYFISCTNHDHEKGMR